MTVGVYVTYRKVGVNEFAHNDALKIIEKYQSNANPSLESADRAF
ncbi:Uncharacterised protein [Vibrio cholerae]|nr:Uncharacterised protein [Vibrio cholerae]